MYPALQSCMMSEEQYSGHYYNSIYDQQYQSHTYHNTPCYQQCYPSQESTYQHMSYQRGVDVPYLSVTDHYSQNQIPSTVPVSAAIPHTCPSSTNRPVKPPYSYAALICMAINSASEKKATMREIILYIEQSFAYYRSNKKWHGTIRHDLTVNDCFVKMDPRPGQKACLWSVHSDFQDMFSSGSLRRRKYRFKQGSTSWLKARKQSIAGHHITKHNDALHPSPSLSDGRSVTDSSNQNDQDPQLISSKLDDVFCNIPSFDECIDELFHSFQSDYYGTL